LAHPYLIFSSTTPAPPQISPLSLHDALPISLPSPPSAAPISVATSPTCTRNSPTSTIHRSIVTAPMMGQRRPRSRTARRRDDGRSEEHTSELQSPCNIVCRLLLEKKKKQNSTRLPHPTHTHISNATRTAPPLAQLYALTSASPHH